MHQSLTLVRQQSLVSREVAAIAIVVEVVVAHRGEDAVAMNAAANSHKN
jgi:hypothetical protein